MSQQHDDTTRIETLLDESDGAAEHTERVEHRERDEHIEPVEHTERADHTEPTEPAAAPSRPPAPVSDSGFGSASSSAATAYAPYQGQATAPGFKSGPAPTTSVVGLLGLLTVIAVLIAQATDLDIAWDVVGPVAVVGAGVLLVVLGLAGLRGQRFRG